MKVTAPDDLDGRIINCIARVRMIQEALDGAVTAIGDVAALSEAALTGMRDTLEEIGDELVEIHQLGIAQANDQDAQLQAALGAIAAIGAVTP